MSMPLPIMASTEQPVRFTKNEVRYTDDHGQSSEQCSKCKYFLRTTRGGSCEIVWGSIKPEGWCNKFKRA